MFTEEFRQGEGRLLLDPHLSVHHEAACRHLRLLQLFLHIYAQVEGQPSGIAALVDHIQVAVGDCHRIYQTVLLSAGRVTIEGQLHGVLVTVQRHLAFIVQSGLEDALSIHLVHQIQAGDAHIRRAEGQGLRSGGGVTGERCRHNAVHIGNLCRSAGQGIIHRQQQALAGCQGDGIGGKHLCAANGHGNADDWVHTPVGDGHLHRQDKARHHTVLVIGDLVDGHLVFIGAAEEPDVCSGNRHLDLHHFAALGPAQQGLSIRSRNSGVLAGVVITGDQESLKTAFHGPGVNVVNEGIIKHLAHQQGRRQAVAGGFAPIVGIGHQLHRHKLIPVGLQGAAVVIGVLLPAVGDRLHPENGKIVDVRAALGEGELGGDLHAVTRGH